MWLVSHAPGSSLWQAWSARFVRWPEWIMVQQSVSSANVEFHSIRSYFMLIFSGDGWRRVSRTCTNIGLTFAVEYVHRYTFRISLTQIQIGRASCRERGLRFGCEL